jgi:uncharacterized protein YhbP (UPF0306 family)
MQAHELRHEIEAFLATHHVMSLATTAAGESAVHAASLFYALDGLSLVWTSDPGVRHSLHVETKCKVAATVAPDCAEWLAVRGVQIAGDACRLRDDAEVERASHLMRRRYPFLDQLASGPPALRQAYAKAGFYRLDPTRITLIDNARGFGHKATLHVLADGAVALVDP